MQEWAHKIKGENIEALNGQKAWDKSKSSAESWSDMHGRRLRFERIDSKQQNRTGSNKFKIGDPDKILKHPHWSK
jgi:hypothetical protein